MLPITYKENTMQKWLSYLLLLIVSVPALADDIPFPPPPLDTVSFQLSQKQWVSTQTALLTVEVNATLSGGDIVQMRKDIVDKLVQIAKGDWHITRLDRSQDASGLEKLSLQAEMRVGQDKLTNIYVDAKKVSKPGVQYSILSVDFKPSMDDMEQAMKNLREQLYKKAQEEIARINAVYGEQHFTINRVDFSQGNAVENPPKMRAMLAASPAPIPANTEVSNELILTAFVQAASTRAKGN